MDVTLEQLQQRLLDYYDTRRRYMSYRYKQLIATKGGALDTVEHSLLEINNAISELRHEILFQQLKGLYELLLSDRS